MSELVLVDGHHLLYRAWFGFPARIRSRDGSRELTGVFGFLALLRKALLTWASPESTVVVVFDGESSADARQRIAPAYKAARRSADHSAVGSLAWVQDALDASRIPWLECADVEADDLIGTLAVRAAEPVLIMSGDRDFHQLVDHRIRQLSTQAAIPLIDPAQVRRRYDIDPAQWTSYRALTGDPADGVPGVRGVGPVLAREIIGSATVDQIDPDPLHRHRRAAIRRAAAEWPEVLATRELLTIDTDVRLGLDPASLSPIPVLPLAARIVDVLGLW